MSETVTAAWLAGDERAVRFLSDAFRREPDRRAAVRRAGRPVDPAVLDAVTARTDAQRRHRDRLATLGTTCVVTGQQAGLFGGPLYTLYKAAGAIVDARALEAESGIPCVPVFWLQSEDHDFDEIATCPVVGADQERHVVSVPHGHEGDVERRRSVGVRAIPDAIAATLDELDAILRPLAHGPETLDRLTRAYRPGATWTHAFAELVEALFADHGLLVVDPSHPALRRAAAPVHEHARAHAEPIAAAAATWAAELEAAGFVAPIHVRPGAPLSFVHPDGPTGPRYRFEPADLGWRLVGTDRVLTDLASGAYTTSAMLRPILQDRLLPTAAYVGGPGEIAYFAQLRPVYDAFDLPMPLVVPRPRFVVRDPACDRILAAWGWRLDRLSEPREQLLSALAPPEAAFDTWLDAREQLLDALEAAEPPARELSKGLGRSVAKTRRTVTRAVDRLIDRYRRALARDNDIVVQRLDRLRAWYTPAGAPQERALSLPTLTARSGWDRLVPALLDAIVPFDGTLREVPLP